MRRTCTPSLFAFAILVAGCGDDEAARSSEPTSGAEAMSETQRIYEEQPVRPTHVARRHAFRAPDGCGQGPWQISFAAQGSAFVEGFAAYVCARHDVRGDARVIAEGRGPYETHVYGYDSPDNARCVASAEERARATSTAPETEATQAPPTRRPRRSARTPRAADVPPAPPPVPQLEVVPGTFEGCPEGTRQIVITSMSFLSREGPALTAGMRVGLELWSAEPNDFEGAIFVLEHVVIDDDVTAESFGAYLDASDAWAERYDAAVRAEVASGRAHIVESSPTTDVPPPPPRDEVRPPRPSENAAWVAGYWHRAGDWIFLPGFWRVPASDVERDLTVHAPAPPPPPRAETPGPAPTPEATWTPGYWQWDGGRYVWVAGAYRIPPDVDQEWKPPTWRVTAGGAIFVPGGWSIGRR